MYNKVSTDLLDNGHKRLSEDIDLKVSEFGGVHEIARKLNTSEQTGLAGDNSDLEHRRDYFGSNTIPPKPAKTFLAVVKYFTFKTLHFHCQALLIFTNEKYSVGLGSFAGCYTYHTTNCSGGFSRSLFLQTPQE